jgi:regulator of sigma E protease
MMSEVIGSIWWLLVSLGVLVTFHEFGHYWVARRCGVKVLRFSVGFGKPLWLHRGKDGTEYVIAAIPLGGYVKMLGEHDPDTPVPADQLAQSHDRQPVWKRMAISLAGPAANLILCVLLLWGMFVLAARISRRWWGRRRHGRRRGAASGRRNTERGRARHAHLERGQHGPACRRAGSQGHHGARARARRHRGRAHVPALKPPPRLRRNPSDAAIGLRGRHEAVAPVIGTVLPGKPAWGVLAEGDRITAIDGEPTLSYQDIVRMAQRWARKSAKRWWKCSAARPPGLAAAAGPAPAEGWQAAVGFGVELVASEPRKDAVLRYGPVAAIPAAFLEAAHQTGELFATFTRAFRARYPPATRSPARLPSRGPATTSRNRVPRTS